MSRPARCGWDAGFLLVEAAVTALLLGVGLLFISRNLSGTLKALESVKQRGTLTLLAESAMAELETKVRQGQDIPRTEHFAKPYEAYEWLLTVEPVDLPLVGLPTEQEKPFSEITLEVRRGERGQMVRLVMLWPTAWLTK